LKAEVLGKALGVALDLLVQVADFDVVESGEVGVEDDALSAEGEDF